MAGDALEVRWDPEARAWYVRPPWSGWTRLDGEGDEAETDPCLRERAWRTVGDRAVLSLRVVRVEG